jgi:arsenical pump membrane protein
LAARRRGLTEDGFLYGTLLMTNAASLLLPGSNLTNLLVLADHPVSGAAFAAQMLPAWIAAVAVTAAFVIVHHRRDLHRPADNALGPAAPAPSWGAVGLVAVAGVLVVALESPALPVLAVALAGAAVAVSRGHLPFRRILHAVDPAMLAGLFGIAVGLGTLARAWPSPSRVLASSGPVATAGLAALASVAVNNLPAAVVFTAHPVAHPRALLLGLNLGPNLAITGSLSAFVWLKAARAVGAQPDWKRITRLGVVLVPLSLAAAGALTHLTTRS